MTCHELEMSKRRSHLFLHYKESGGTKNLNLNLFDCGMHYVTQSISTIFLPTFHCLSIGLH